MKQSDFCNCKCGASPLITRTYISDGIKTYSVRCSKETCRYQKRVNKYSLKSLLVGWEFYLNAIGKKKFKHDYLKTMMHRG